MISLTDGKVARAGQVFVHSKSLSTELPSATALDVEGCGLAVAVFCSAWTVDRLTGHGGFFSCNFFRSQGLSVSDTGFGVADQLVKIDRFSCHVLHSVGI